MFSKSFLERCQKYNLEVLERGLDEHFGLFLFRFKDCGHKQHIHPIQMPYDKCQTCEKEKLKSQALEKGFEIVEFNSADNKNTYRDISCGHLITVRHSTILSDSKTQCIQCDTERFKLNARKKGLIFIKRTGKSNYNLYRFSECGHSKITSNYSVENYTQHCEICGSNYLSKKAVFYVIEVSNEDKSHSFLKIGISNNTKNRIKAYKLSSGYKAKVLDDIMFNTHLAARRFESKFHSKFLGKRLEPTEMKNVMLSGFNECYPLSVGNSILPLMRALKAE